MRELKRTIRPSNPNVFFYQSITRLILQHFQVQVKCSLNYCFPHCQLVEEAERLRQILTLQAQRTSF